jgi:hypothetical protein
MFLFHTSFPGELCLKGFPICGLAFASFSGGRAVRKEERL